MASYERTNDFEERMNEHIKAKQLARYRAAHPAPVIIPEEKHEIIIEEISAPKISKTTWIISIFLILILLGGAYFYLI